MICKDIWIRFEYQISIYLFPTQHWISVDVQGIKDAPDASVWILCDLSLAQGQITFDGTIIQQYDGWYLYITESY